MVEKELRQSHVLPACIRNERDNTHALTLLFSLSLDRSGGKQNKGKAAEAAEVGSKE